MKKINKHYLAGFIDGEGYIGAIKAKDGRTSRGYTISIRVDIINTNKELLQKLNRIVNGIIYESKKKKRCKKLYTLRVQGLKSIKKFLEYIIDSLIIKKEQAKLMIEYCNQRLKNHYRKYNKLELKFVDKLSKLNRRGDISN